jgi:tRNA(fMet)-specific endonuclease VapC
VFPDQSTGAWYGELKAELAAAGTPIPENDIRIATVARQFDLSLATRDAHFLSVSRLETLAR